MKKLKQFISDIRQWILYGVINRERVTCFRVNCKNERPINKPCCEKHQKEVDGL